MKKILTLLLGIIFLTGCTKDEKTNEADLINNETPIMGNPISDFDKNLYSTVIIGAQTWTQQNLNVSHYSDGTLIPQVTDYYQWITTTKGAWCYYNNNTANGNTYGKLYNWYAVAGVYNEASKKDVSLRKKLAPLGYHIPTKTEWLALTNYLGMYAAIRMKEAGYKHWQSSNLAKTGTNSSGFIALPGGDAFGLTGEIGTNGNWWSSTGSITNFTEIDKWSIHLFSRSDYVSYYDVDINSGLSVRCLKD